METTVHHALKPTSNVNNRYFLRHLATIMMSQLTVNLSLFIFVVFSMCNNNLFGGFVGIGNKFVTSQLLLY